MLLNLKGSMVARFGSVKAFAEVVGIDRPRVSEVIHRKRKLSAAEKGRWARILGRDRKELFPRGHSLLGRKPA